MIYTVAHLLLRLLQDRLLLDEHLLLQAGDLLLGVADLREADGVALLQRSHLRARGFTAFSVYWLFIVFTRNRLFKVNLSGISRKFE